MTSAYVRQLQRETHANDGTAELTPPTLEQRIVMWYESQPAVSRDRRYSMVELERALGTQGRFLSPVLCRLGWKRGRQWSSTGPNPRYWVPPGT